MREESESESEEVESVESESEESGEESDSHKDVGLMDDDEWVKIGDCEVMDHWDGNHDAMLWREVGVYGRKDQRNPCNRVILWFGGDEYEGMPDGTYRYEKGNGLLLDTDGDPIRHRNMIMV